METRVMINELKNTMNKHMNDRVFTGGTNVSALCRDVIPKLEKLEKYEKLDRHEDLLSQEFKVGSIFKSHVIVNNKDDVERTKKLLAEQASQLFERIVTEKVDEFVEEKEFGGGSMVLSYGFILSLPRENLEK